MLPAIAFIVLLYYVPMPGAILAFKNYKPALGIYGSGWADPLWKNFIFFFRSDTAFQITRNTVAYNLANMALGTVFAIAFAIMLSELRGKFFPGLYKGLMILPVFLSWIVVQYIAYSLLSMDRGLINNAIASLGGTPVEWYSKPFYWVFIMPIAFLWKGVGNSAVFYVAAIAGISVEYYEAATIDGATKWQQIRKITLPLLKPTVIVLTLLSLGNVFGGDWTAYYTITNNSGALYPATDVIGTYVYRSLRSNPSYAMTAAVGLYQTAVGFALVLLTNFAVSKADPENKLF
jgi:putative aldouronate transport system permease protein